ncbi:MAG: hypothetical protein EBV03_07970 [Proteobacteria bacterium]|nr:hypothetical protein [Pseudomonadota bacterium]
MKISALIAGAALVVATFGTANADEVNFSGSSVNMGSVAVGQFGTITNIYQTLFTLPPHVVGSGEAFGFLPHNAKITFTYTLNGLLDGQLQGYSAYDHILGGNHYQGSAIADSDGSASASGTINGGASSPLVFASANLSVGNPSVGTVVMTNVSGAFASFQTLFFGILAAFPVGSGVINYNVSQVPLPAALPMFGALLAGMFGVSRRRKQVAA